MGSWNVSLNGIGLSGGVDTPAASGLGSVEGYLSVPPDGLGVPPLRTEDQVFPQRDGMAQYSDWYEPRIITLEEVSITSDGCTDCSSPKVRARRITEAWSRSCGDEELVIITDCHGEQATELDTLLSENLMVNPAAAVNLDGWSMVSSGTLTRENAVATPAPVFGTYYGQNVDPTTGAAILVGVAPIQVLSPYAAGLYVRSNSATSASAQMYFADNLGVVVATGPASAIIPVPANTWTWIPIPGGLSGAATTNGYIYVATASGTTTQVTGALVVEGFDAPTAYFDGDTADTPTEEYSWSGTPGTSTSLKYGLGDLRYVVGPFGVRGRPRVAEVEWYGGGVKAAQALLRFDSIDHRLYVLDEQGTPGSGGECSDPINSQLSSVSYLQAVASTASLARYWRLNETSGFTALATVGGVNGTLVGGTHSVEPLAVGTSRAYRRGVVTLPFPAFVGPMSLEFWVQHEGTGSDIFVSGAGFQFAQETSGTQFTWDGITYTQADGLPNLAMNTPYHIVITSSATEVVIYVNGYPWFEQTVGAAATSAATNWVFGDASATENIRSDVAYYTSALTFAQAAQHYQASQAFTGSQGISVSGGLCVPIEITFSDTTMTRPRIFLPDGSFVGVSSIPAGATQMTVNTEIGMASYVDVLGKVINDPSLVTGDPFLTVNPGYSGLAMAVQTGSGTATVCWRPAVISA